MLGPSPKSYLSTSMTPKPCRGTMARKGYIIARGASTWLVRVYLGRDPSNGSTAQAISLYDVNSHIPSEVLP
jgi:hypothetical protein